MPCIHRVDDKILPRVDKLLWLAADEPRRQFQHCSAKRFTHLRRDRYWHPINHAKTVRYPCRSSNREGIVGNCQNVGRERAATSARQHPISPLCPAHPASTFLLILRPTASLSILIKFYNRPAPPYTSPRPAFVLLVTHLSSTAITSSIHIASSADLLVVIIDRFSG